MELIKVYLTNNVEIILNPEEISFIDGNILYLKSMYSIKQDDGSYILDRTTLELSKESIAGLKRRFFNK